jgi:hypothetical protein
MHRFIPAFLLLVCNIDSYAQRIPVRLRIDPQKPVVITMEIKNSVAQQAGGQAIDFFVSGSLVHEYKAEQVSAGNQVLHHSISRLNYQFDGMGQKRSFDSRTRNANEGPLEKQFEQIVASKYDLYIDEKGNTVRTIPEKINSAARDEKLVIITDMLKDLAGIASPPAKGTASFFGIFPGNDIGTGDTWTDSTNNENERSVTVNTVSGITDSTIIIDFKTTTYSTAVSEMMGRPAKTILNTAITGTMIIDRNTGILRGKTSMAESNGTTEAMGGSLPITGRTSILIKVSNQ